VASASRGAGRSQLVTVNLGHLAIVVHARGDTEQAARHFEKALTVRAQHPQRLSGAACSLTRAVRVQRMESWSSPKASLARASRCGDLKDPLSRFGVRRFAELGRSTAELQSEQQPSGAPRRACSKDRHSDPLNEEADHERAVATTRVAWAMMRSTGHGAKAGPMKPEEAVRYTLHGRGQATPRAMAQSARLERYHFGPFEAAARQPTAAEGRRRDFAAPTRFRSARRARRSRRTSRHQGRVAGTRVVSMVVEDAALHVQMSPAQGHWYRFHHRSRDEAINSRCRHAGQTSKRITLRDSKHNLPYQLTSFVVGRGRRSRNSTSS